MKITSKVMHAIVDKATGAPLTLHDTAREAALSLPPPESSRIARDFHVERAFVTIETFDDGAFVCEITNFQLSLNLVR